MNVKLWLSALLAALGCCQFSARAEEPWVLFDGCKWSFPKLCDEWKQRCCWCNDDYCPKQMPVPPCPVKGCVDDYCPKTLPCTLPAAKGCVDDYCPKMCPLLLWRCCGPCCTCGPPEETCGPCRPAKSKH